MAKEIQQNRLRGSPMHFLKKMKMERRPTSMGSHLGGMHLAGIGSGVFAQQVSQARGQRRQRIYRLSTRKRWIWSIKNLQQESEPAQLLPESKGVGELKAS